MMRKPLTIAALGCVLALAGGCASTPTALDRGNAYYRDGLYFFAADEFSESIRQDPGLPAAYVNRGITRVRLGRLTEAIEDYNHAIALDPRNPEIYFDRGNALVAAGLPGPAIEDFSRAVELSPVYAKAWFNRGSARALAGQLGGARSDWQRAIELESDPWARAAMRRSARLEPNATVAWVGTPTTEGTVAPAPAPGMTVDGVALPPPATLAATPAASPASPASIDARGLAIRAMGRELDGDHDGALMDLRAALAAERDPARRATLESLLRKLEGAR
jgi:tetratricopeptide (TPR) repeat protein